MTEEQKQKAEKKFKNLQGQELSKNDYKEAEKKAGKLGEQMENFKIMLSMIKDYWDGKFDIPNVDLAIIIGAILYVVSPIDAIPDFIPVIGWIDDIGIVALAIAKINNTFNRYKSMKRIAR